MIDDGNEGLLYQSDGDCLKVADELDELDGQTEEEEEELRFSFPSFTYFCKELLTFITFKFVWVNPSSLIKPKFTRSSNHPEMVTRWSPSGHQVVTKLSTSGYQVVTKSNNSFPKMVIFCSFVIKMSRVAFTHFGL